MKTYPFITDQELIDFHYAQVLEILKNGSESNKRLIIASLNYMKPKSKLFAFVGAQLVMHGQLTINDQNALELKS